MNDHQVSVSLEVGDGSASASIEGDLIIPERALGVVLFAHGSGSSRFSPRNRRVADSLREGGLGTLLIDLLTKEEETSDERTGHLRFDIAFLARRLAAAADWLSGDADTARLPIGCFGASTGGAAALVLAADWPDLIQAVVSRGGRPDLAMAALPRVAAPTLLIVGGADIPVIEMNKTALSALKCEKRLAIIARASHLFEEPGALEKVAILARDWFTTHLPGR